MTSDGEPIGTFCVSSICLLASSATDQSEALEIFGRQMSLRLQAIVQRERWNEALAEKERASADLRASEELFRAFMNASPFLSYIKDAAGGCSSITAASRSGLA